MRTSTPLLVLGLMALSPLALAEDEAAAPEAPAAEEAATEEAAEAPAAEEASASGISLPTPQKGYWHAERSVVINAAPEHIYPFLVDLEEWPSWTAWGPERDPEGVWEFSGPSGEVGATMTWDGKEVGNGKLAITELHENEALGYNVWFGKSKEPSVGVLLLEPGEAGTTVTWADQGKLGFLGRLMRKAIEGAVGTDFEVGLAKLKIKAETAAMQAKLAEEAEAATGTLTGATDALSGAVEKRTQTKELSAAAVEKAVEDADANYKGRRSKKQAALDEARATAQTQADADNAAAQTAVEEALAAVKAAIEPAQVAGEAAAKGGGELGAAASEAVTAAVEAAKAAIEAASGSAEAEGEAGEEAEGAAE